MDMATSPRAVPVEEYEYGLSCSKQFSEQTLLTLNLSYETLPPNFSLVDNMLAGAFAGIAVRLLLPIRDLLLLLDVKAHIESGAHCHVSCRSTQGDYVRVPQRGDALTIPRHVCR